MEFKVGTRGSKLALAQTELVIRQLQEKHPEDVFSCVIISTKGDRDQKSSLNTIGGQGVFVKEIEKRLMDGEIDLAVHSFKDVPTDVGDAFTLVDPWLQEDDRDVLITEDGSSIFDLREGAVIATGSIRRKKQLLKLRNDLIIEDIRGNIDTRIRKMKENGYDGIVLAAAGLNRLDITDVKTYTFAYEEMVPSVTQGIICVEIRKNDAKSRGLFDDLKDEEIAWRAKAERCFLTEMNATCKDVIGAYVQNEHELHVVYASEDSDLLHASYACDDAEACAKKCASMIRQQLDHRVLIVGSGIGDAGLLTLQAKEAIESADCILYDRLIAQDILALAKKDCEMIYVGKKADLHTMKQEDITALLVKKAMQYRCVVRLKGGDPYIFGRGGEEALVLHEKGIHTEVYAGISSALAAPLRAGIPLTYRGIAQGFTVMTAVNRNKDLSHIDFAALAKSKNTLVFLMGLSHLKDITGNLIAYGMARDTKAAVISNAASTMEKVCTGTLETIVDEAEREEIASPAVIVVGEVVKFHELFYPQKNREEKKEYYFAKIGTEVSPLTEVLRRTSIVREVQVSEIVFPEVKLNKEDFGNTEVLMFASRHGVYGMMKTLNTNGMDVRDLFGKKIVTSSLKTVSVLRDYGLWTDEVFASKNEMIAAYSDNKAILFAGEDKTVSDTLMVAGVYRNQAVNNGMITIAEDAKVIFTASSSVKRFMALLKEENRAAFLLNGTAYAIGRSTAKTLEESGMKRIITAQKPSYESLYEVIGEDV